MTRVKSRPRRVAGFTMVELLITMLLLSIVLMGLAALQVAAIQQTTTSKRGNEATRLAQTRIEWYMTRGTAPGTTSGWVLEKKRDGSTDMTNVGGDGETAGPYAVYRMVELPTGGGALITIKVVWRDQKVAVGAKENEVRVSWLR